MNYPLCFDSHDDYLKWERAAIYAKEYATPCGDCTRAYRGAMGDRCKKLIVNATFVVNSTRKPPTQEIENESAPDQPNERT